MAPTKAAYVQLNQAIEELLASDEDLNEDDGLPEMVTDSVLLVGLQFVGHDGGRCGRMVLYPRDGSQPYYITEGLLYAALSAVSTSKGEA